MLDVLRAGGATRIEVSRDEAQRLKFWSGRKNAFPASGRISPDYMCMDSTIPRKRLADILIAIAEMERKYGLRCCNVFHAGDGNLHPLILFDANDPDQLHRAELFGADILETSVAARRHGHRRARRRHREAEFDVRAVQRPRSASRCCALKARVRPDGPAQPRQGDPDAAALCRVRQDACAAAACCRSPSSRGFERPRRVALSTDRDGVLRTHSSTAFRPRATPTARAARIRGGGTKDFYGEPPRGEPLDMRGCAGISSYEPSELVVTARCGTPLAELEAALAEARPVPAVRAAALRRPQATRAPRRDCRRHGRGRAGRAGARRRWARCATTCSARRCSTAAARCCSFGGQVMKNVAGYDVSRLLAGSMGIARRDPRGVAEGAADAAGHAPRCASSWTSRRRCDRLNDGAASRCRSTPARGGAACWCCACAARFAAVDAAIAELGGELIDAGARQRRSGPACAITRDEFFVSAHRAMRNARRSEDRRARIARCGGCRCRRPRRRCRCRASSSSNGAARSAGCAPPRRCRRCARRRRASAAMPPCSRRIHESTGVFAPLSRRSIASTAS